MTSLFGIETEYGIAVEGAETTALVAASRDVVRHFRGRYGAPWNYRAEDPRNDVRGFHVEKLSQDATDAQFDRPADKVNSPTEDRCDRVLQNGARFYNDHGHPEYATPECADLRSLVAHDKAGERIVWAAACAYSEESGKEVGIFKNNTDFHGASYGTHESYVLRRSVPWDDVVRTLAPFLATRIIYAGAGKVGIEERGAAWCNYQISQRADFFSVLQSVDTLANRPLVNTRDEPHGDPRRARRLHVIAGDANMSEYATALRVGALNLVVALLESGWTTPVELRDPIAAIKSISRDQTYKWIIEDERGEGISAVDVQRCFLRAAQELEIPGSEWILEEWQRTLDALDSDPLSLYDRLDWVAKKLLLDDFAASEKLNWRSDAATLQSLDLAYHDVDTEVGLYYGLVESEMMQTLVSEAEIIAAQSAPPSHTRASLRGLFVRRFAENIKAISWGAIIAEDNGQKYNLRLPKTANFLALSEQIENASSFREAAAILQNSHEQTQE